MFSQQSFNVCINNHKYFKDHSKFSWILGHVISPQSWLVQIWPFARTINKIRNCWSEDHFNQDSNTYLIPHVSLTDTEQSMKVDLHGPIKFQIWINVSPTTQGEWFISTRAVVNENSTQDMKELFGKKVCMLWTMLAYTILLNLLLMHLILIFR